MKLLTKFRKARKQESIIQDLLLHSDNQGKHYAEFTIDRKIWEKMQLQVGDELNFKEN